MPIYEYECQDCEAEFEELVRSSEEPADLTCPQCGSRQVHRQLSLFAARNASASAGSSLPAPGPCGRCGDPRGSCQT